MYCRSWWNHCGFATNLQNSVILIPVKSIPSKINRCLGLRCSLIRSYSSGLRI
ncbi:MAG: hypothetical protein WC277_08830 [Bacilli bacterium]